MKIQDKRPNAAKAAAATKAKPAGAKQKLFSEKLRKGQQSATTAKNEPTPEPKNLVPRLLSDRPPIPQQQEHSRPEELRRISATSLPAPLQGLVSEIQMHVERGGPVEVEIQFNSQVFDGLRVNITKEEGAIAIKFTTSNDTTAQLLNQHVPALTHALTSKGIAVSGISMNTGSGAGSGSGSGSDSAGNFGSARGRQKKGR